MFGEVLPEHYSMASQFREKFFFLVGWSDRRDVTRMKPVGRASLWGLGQPGCSHFLSFSFQKPMKHMRTSSQPCLKALTLE